MFFRSAFYRVGRFKQLIKCTHVWQDIHLFCVLHSTPCGALTQGLCLAGSQRRQSERLEFIQNGCGCLHYGCHSSSGPFQHADSFGLLSCRCGFRSEPVCQMQVSGCCQWRELNSTQDRVLIKSLTCPTNMRPTVYILECSELICRVSLITLGFSVSVPGLWATDACLANQERMHPKQSIKRNSLEQKSTQKMETKEAVSEAAQDFWWKYIVPDARTPLHQS